MFRALVFDVVVTSIVLTGPTLSPGGAQELRWLKVAGEDTPNRSGSVLLYAADLRQMVLLGPGKEDLSVHVFDPATQRWSELCRSAPPAKNFHPYYQAAYDPGTKAVYCLSGGNVLYCFDIARKTWKALPPARELDGLSWHTLACDTDRGRLAAGHRGCGQEGGQPGLEPHSDLRHSLGSLEPTGVSRWAHDASLRSTCGARGPDGRAGGTDPTGVVSRSPGSWHRRRTQGFDRPLRGDQEAAPGEGLRRRTG